MVKSPPANAGDIRETGLIPGLGSPLGEAVATHSSILAFRITWGGAWQVRDHSIAELDTTEAT